MSFPAYPAYKDSGVEWLGKVPQHWPVYSLKRTVDGCVNGLWGDEPGGENDIAVIRVADFERSFSTVGLDKLTYRSITPKERHSRLIKSGDLLIEKSGGGEKTLVGCVVLFTHEFDAITSNFVARMRPLAEFDSQFLCYAFGNLYHGRVNYPSVKQVTGIQNLDAESYLQERFCFPARVEQTQIARFLDHETACIDALIEEQQRLIELLKEKRQAVISHAVTKGLDPTVPMKDSGVEWLGEVPAHWEVKKLKHFGRVTGGFAFKSTEFTSEGHPVLKISNVGHLCFEWGDQSYLPDEFRESHSEFIAPKGALVFAMTRPVIAGGIKVARLEDDSLPLVNQRVGFMVVHDVDLSRYLLLSTQSDPFLNQFKNNLTITNQPNISSEGIESISIAVPPLIDMKNILAFCQKFDTAVQGLIGDALRGTELLQERRSALISAAVTGKIDVRGWQPPTSAPTPELAQEAV
ncbi:MAG: restriction endonuclease subunit S [Pseudomonadaceae bacterium]|nr:restriction endonuclease subunit S [Pseudomonadaceae bacterium]